MKPHQILARFERYLRPGGAFGIAVPNPTSESPDLRRGWLRIDLIRVEGDSLEELEHKMTEQLQFVPVAKEAE